ncbi:unnamed protein product [Rangifer tarandus platyrhynchus]|uniref:Uncharacterized protein n=1 Tax=Rangifer tarandus platyrhynchus TaxID=3082113 RepID=A0AC59Z1A5_RANTA
MFPDPRPTLLPGTLLTDEEEASAPGTAEPVASGSNSWTSPSCSSCPPPALVQALLSFPPRLSLFPVSRIFLFSLFRWSRTQLSRGRSWCPRGRFHFLLLLASSACLHFHVLDHLPQADCPLCHRVAPALSLESWSQDFPCRGHRSPENTGLLHVPVTILFLPHFWMGFDSPASPEARSCLGTKDVTETVVQRTESVRKQGLRGPFFVPSQFLLIRVEMCCVELESPAQIVRPQAAHNGRGVARLGLNLPPDQPWADRLPSSVTRGRNSTSITFEPLLFLKDTYPEVHSNIRNL